MPNDILLSPSPRNPRSFDANSVLFATARAAAGHGRKLYRRPDRRCLHLVGRLERLVRPRLRHLLECRQEHPARRAGPAHRAPRRRQRDRGACHGGRCAGPCRCPLERGRDRHCRPRRWQYPQTGGPGLAGLGLPEAAVWMPGLTTSRATGPRCAASQWARALAGRVGTAASHDHLARATAAGAPVAQAASAPPWPWHFLYFLPEPHQHGSLRPGSAALRTVSTRGPMWRHRSRRSYTAQMASP